MTAAGSSGDARSRIIASARRGILEYGERGANSAQVGAEAGVSKALVHYHFADKQALLLAVVDDCGQRIERRLRLVPDALRGTNAFERCRKWLAEELEAVDIHLLLRLAGSGDEAVRNRARSGIQVFRSAVEAQLETALESLAVAPTIRMDLIASLASATALGLAGSDVREASGDREATLDTLWLAILGLSR